MILEMFLIASKCFFHELQSVSYFLVLFSDENM